MRAAPELTVVIPIHNEETILADSVAGLLDRLPAVAPSFEILLAENGSNDGTLAIAADLAARHPEVRFFSAGEPNYGKALRRGLEEARGELVVCDEIDLLDLDFYRAAIGLLRSRRADMVVGSKLAPGARDERPWLRHLASQVLNGLLRLTLDFKGTDTHGLKALRREPLLPVARACVVERNLFASELVIRAERAGLTVVEVPLCVREKRSPTINLVRRVPEALGNLATLVYVIRFKEK
ncbi:MAG TPA: glycosyltransferase family 2 protein [Myxococcota bacterium]|nr:glycosyltransferase family 2 protein [Myxococcota bacterium]HRY93124.1 glycosyltransferase family 2 protein [Myxococcota bacterium]